MYKYLLEQERTLLKALENEEDLREIYEYAKTQIAWISHERLVHLLVTLFFGGLLLVSLAGALFLPNELSATATLLFIILTVLVLFYVVHYYRLENGVQRLYKVSNQIYNKIHELQK